MNCHFYPSLYQLGSLTHFKDFVWLCVSFWHQQHQQQTSYWLLGSIIGHCCCIWRAGTRFECFKVVLIPPSLSPTNDHQGDMEVCKGSQIQLSRLNVFLSQAQVEWEIDACFEKSFNVTQRLNSWGRRRNCAEDHVFRLSPSSSLKTSTFPVRITVRLGTRQVSIATELCLLPFTLLLEAINCITVMLLKHY